MDVLMQGRWELGLGAEARADGVTFRVWAPKRKQVEVAIIGNEKAFIPLAAEPNGYFSGKVNNARPGTLYRYRLDGEESFPDPCSRYQPQGPHGPSMVVDPCAYKWNDQAWPGVEMAGQVIYELHVGTFTPQGSFDAAAQQLAALKQLGVTLVEIMPVAEFPGERNWGYDGVDLYAPAHVYGDPEALKRFVDASHALGIGVLLDVVYNHFGPDGNYVSAYSDDYFTTRYENDWGEAINFDGPGSAEVREFFIRNACYWIAEFHMDGLRLDATQNICDAGPVHVLAELSRRSRETVAPRRIVLTAENEPQDITCITPVDKGGYGLDAVWNDDFHHAARVALMGRREAYYTDYRGEAQELLSAVKRGYLYQGQRYKWQKQPRGTPVTVQPASAFVFYLQNHDQVANSLHGERIHMLTSPGRYRAMMALLLLAPETPLLFMGQEFGASRPFLFFTDHRDLAASIYQGRKKFLSQFPSYGSPEAQGQVPDPSLRSTFERSKLDLSERTTHAHMYLFHQDLLRLRREDSVLRMQSRERLDGAVLGPHALVLRFFGGDGDDRLLAVNLGADLEYDPAPEPLLAPPAGRAWEEIWSSDAPRYGGPGIIPACTVDGWRFPGASAAFFSVIPRRAGIKKH
jgi:maltooligosyltrehalose trehalohydrolase